MTENSFRLITLLIIITTFGISGYFRHRAEMHGGKLRSNNGQRSLSWIRFLGLSIWLPILLYIVNPAWVTLFKIEIPSWLRVAAVMISAIDTILIYWMFRTLDTNISPSHEARENATLITSGPYRFIRHPLYTFGYVAFASLTLMTSLVWMFLITLLPFILFIAWRTPREEEKLIAVFGDDYRQYMTQTGRFLPKLS